MEKFKRLKIAFIHGRPLGHPTHAMYAKLIGSTFFHEDRILRWQDLPINKPRRYTSWFLNAIFFKQRKSWDIFFTECVRIPQLILKKFWLTRSRQKLVALMSDESLFFTYSNRFPRVTKWLMITFWKNCDAIICVGEFQKELAEKVLPQSHHKKLYTIINGIPNSRLQTLLTIRPNIENKNILFIGNASSRWRIEYKGLDLMVKSFDNCLQELSELTFTIVGDIPENLQQELRSSISKEAAKKIIFVGKKDKIESYLSDTSLYLHCARGEAWGISISEALSAGVPSIVSTQTGTKQIVKHLGNEFISDLTEDDLTQKILNYYSLPIEEKTKLSIKSREIVKQFTEANAQTIFLQQFSQVISDLKLDL